MSGPVNNTVLNVTLNAVNLRCNVILLKLSDIFHHWYIYSLLVFFFVTLGFVMLLVYIILTILSLHFIMLDKLIYLKIKHEQ